MVASEVEKIVLDYAGVEGLDDILKNLSGVATAGSFLWTASDEGRTVECLEPSGDDYRLRKQHHLDCLFDCLPRRGGHRVACVLRWRAVDLRLALQRSLSNQEGSQEGGGRTPLPLETQVQHTCWPASSRQGVADGRRRHTGEAGISSSVQKKQGKPAQHPEGQSVSQALYRPAKQGERSRHRRLHHERWKIAVPRTAWSARRSLRRRRGTQSARNLKSAKPKMATHFLELDGLAVRDLAHFDNKEILVLAGPVGDAPGPFELYRWRPRNSACAQKPTKLDWSIDPKQEKPEGICRLDRNGKSGVIVLYDSPDPCKRMNGSTYKADWFPLT